MLLGIAAIRGEQKTAMEISKPAFSGLLIVSGVVAYWLNGVVKPEGWIVPEREPSPGTD